MTIAPFVIARYGVYLAVALATCSVYLAYNAGMAFDIALLRALFVFVLFTVLALGIEALLTLPGNTRPFEVPQTPIAESGDQSTASFADQDDDE